MAIHDNRVKIISEGKAVSKTAAAEPKTEETKKKPLMVGSIPADSRISADIVPFKAIGKTMRISNVDLSAIINSYYRPIFHDYVGSYIIPDVGGKPGAELVFERNPEPVSDSKITNVIDLTDTHVNDLSKLPGAALSKSKGHGRPEEEAGSGIRKRRCSLSHPHPGWPVTDG